MTSDKSKFIKLKAIERGHVTYGDNNRRKILDLGVLENPTTTNIVLLVKCLRHNLLIISKLCDKW